MHVMHVCMCTHTLDILGFTSSAVLPARQRMQVLQAQCAKCMLHRHPQRMQQLTMPAFMAEAILQHISSEANISTMKILLFSNEPG